MLVAGANVGFRDLKELTQVLFLIWFYLTPVILPRAMIDQLLVSDPSTALRLADKVVAVNPMTWYVGWFQQTMYGEVTAAAGAACPPDPVSGAVVNSCLVASAPGWPDPLTILVCSSVAVVMFIVGYAAFTKMARNFAKAV
jgi:ABC-type polysaccharide/polyol phosphate export permease